MALAYDRTGSGPPLVLLHPLGADRHVWDPVTPALAERRTVIAVDLPGFGQSPPLVDDTPTPRALAGAVGELVDELGLGRPHVAGNSLGGWAALELGLAGRAASVAAIAPAGLWSSPLVPKASLAHRLAHRLRPLIEPASRSGPGRALLLSGSVAHPGRVPPAQVAHLVRAYADAPGFVAVNDAMRAAHFTALAEVRCPVMLLWPDHDRLIARPEEIPAGIVNVELADAGHIPMWDAPEAVVEALLAASAGAA